MAELNIEGTRLLARTLDSTARVIVHEGGSGSSKTFSLAQAHIVWSFQERNRTYSVVRKTLPAMKRGALKDFREALILADCGHRFHENKTDLFYVNLDTGTRIEFFALDDPQKGRGPRRDRLWVNEANELSFEDWRQLAMRTRYGICLDYNPSMQRHWIYDQVLTRTDVDLIHSTYRDNPYLTPENVREIEADVPVYQEEDGTVVTDWDLTYTGRGYLISGDPYRWAVFGLGQRGAPGEAIYPQVYESTGIPEGADTVLGLDFGYNHPLVLVRLAKIDREGRPELHVDELIHESYLTTDDLIDRMRDVGIGRHELIYADGSRPESIKQLQRAGFNVQPADKSKGSVYQGISFLKGHRLLFTARSDRSRAQFQDYRWKKLPDGTVTDEPVKLNDDAPDAVRYGAFTYWGRPKGPSGSLTSFTQSNRIRGLTSWTS